jgi:putative transposase
MKSTHYRTVRIKLDAPSDRKDDLHRTKKQFLNCANRTREWAWRHEEHCVTEKVEAQNALYDKLKAETDLTANVV